LRCEYSAFRLAASGSVGAAVAVPSSVSSTLRRMRIGLVGTGYWATAIHGPGAAGCPRVEFVGVWGRDATRAAEVARGFGVRAYAEFDALLDDVDALTFAIPPDAQADLATRAAERGKHLLLEKPIASMADAALRLERAVTTAHVASVVFFTRRFVPETAEWLERVAHVDGWECGRAEFASRIFVPDGPFANSPWRRDKGALWDVGPHAMALLWPVLGDVTTVLAGAGRGDQVHLVLQHAGGASSTASLSLTVPAAATGSQMYVYGEAGRESAPLGALPSAEIVAAHQRALDALVDQVGQPEVGHACDVHFGARVVEVLAAAEQSLQTGTRVQVALYR
jgi:predicted dehydrogenase